MSDNPVFEDAFARFLDTLSETDRQRYSPCASSKDLLEGLQKLDVITKKRQRRQGSRLLAVIKSFSDHLEPYFQVVSVFIQSDPTKAALIWGAILLVLQLASNFVTFFEKLIRNIERLTEAFPQYDRIAKLCTNYSSSKLMGKHLEEVYVDLLQFFQSVARVFTNAKGKIKRTPVVIGELLWTPFDARFQELLDRMAHHRELVKLDVLLFQTERTGASEVEAVKERLFAAEEREQARIRARDASAQAGCIRAELQRQRRESSLHRITQWLAAPPFSESLNEAQAIREDGTNYWLFKQNKFRQWKEGTLFAQDNSTGGKRKTSSNVLWIHGNPGSGKTVLASSTVEELTNNTIVKNDQVDLLYFFFKSVSLSEGYRASAYRSVLCQILHLYRTDECMLDRFLFAYESSSIVQRIATTATLVDILQLCLSDIQSCIFVLDGIDECSDRKELIAELHQFASTPCHKFLLLSRRNVPQLATMVPKDLQIEMDRRLVGDDIARYLQTQLERLIDDELLPEDADINDLVSHLVRGADGMFLWARLMVSYLNSPALTSSMRIRTIQEVVLPEGLEPIYERIIGLIQGLHKPERDLAGRVLMWLTYSITPLDMYQLHYAVMTDLAGDDNSHKLKDFAETVTFVCGNLVEFRVGDSTGLKKLQAAFIHLSVKEYFTQLDDSSPSVNSIRAILPPKPIANLFLSEQCFRLLTRQTPVKRPPPGFGCLSLMTIETGLWSFMKYAAQNVMRHLSATAMFSSTPTSFTHQRWKTHAEAMIQSCVNFLNSPMTVSAWIETYYAFNNVSFNFNLDPLQLANITTWTNWAAHLPSSLPLAEELRSLAQDLQEFTRDMRDMTQHWNDRLEDTPRLIWDEVAAYSRSRFILPSLTTNVTFLEPRKPCEITSSSQPLCTVSATSSDGSKSGVLSVWPSRTYEERWRNLQPAAPLSSMLDLCQGWTATYEVWSLEGTNPYRVKNIQISLEEQEISLQMRQSFRQEYTAVWKTSFPLVISPELNSFIILRTIFTLRAASCSFSNIDMSFSETTNHYWSPDLEIFSPKNEVIRNLPPALQHLHHDWYSYRFTFSPNGRYILFVDSIHTDHKHNLAVFQRTSSRNVSAEFLSALTLTVLLSKPTYKSIFHPELDIVIFLHNAQVGIWEFTKGGFLHVTSIDTNLSPHVSIEELLLSDCGKYVLLIAEKKNHVIPIPDRILAGCSFDHPARATATVAFQPASDKALTKLSSMDVSQFNLQPRQILKADKFRFGQDGSRMLTRSGRGLEIKLAQRQGMEADECQTLNIMTLPDISHLESTVPTIKLPEHGSTMLQINMNKKQQEGYSITQKPLDQIPVIINRDTRFMAVQHISNPDATQHLQDKSDQRISSTLGTTELASYKVIGLQPSEATLAFDDIEKTMSKRLKTYHGN